MFRRDIGQYIFVLRVRGSAYGNKREKHKKEKLLPLAPARMC